MKLPIEASDDDGILTKNGTMIYGKEDDAVTIGVQPLKDETGNVSFEGVRTLITINESTASKEYTFAYVVLCQDLVQVKMRFSSS